MNRRKAHATTVKEDIQSTPVQGETSMYQASPTSSPQPSPGLAPQVVRRSRTGLSRGKRRLLIGLVVVLALTIVQAIYFQAIFRSEGPKRDFDFSTSYKAAYDVAVAQPVRPIYLEDGYWGPDYVNALWYATVERRPTSEFVHLDWGAKPPSGAIVLSSNETCKNCEIIKRGAGCLLYKSE